MATKQTLIQCERCEVYGRERSATRRQTFRHRGDDPTWKDAETFRCEQCAQALRDYARLPSISLIITSDTELEGGPREVERRKARTTGTYVVLYDRGVRGTLLPTGEIHREDRWETICEKHGGVCSHQTRALARSFLAAPEEWCEECAAELEEREERAR